MTLNEAFTWRLNQFTPGSLTPSDEVYIKTIWTNGWIAAFDRFQLLNPKTPEAFEALMETMFAEWQAWQEEFPRIMAAQKLER